MIANAFAIALHAFCRQRPFRSFTLIFNTGERLVISQPEAIELLDEDSDS
jgi:hypothetical protein